ncbi:MAG: hypothetical protein ACJAYE_000411 [Candidatus Azotimanducaceae bacterium]|jgi:hypothetical protein
MHAAEPQNLTEKLKSQGVLRLLLQSAALLLIMALPFSEPQWHPEGWDLVPGAVIPALSPIIFILLMLDVMMCAIWKSDSEDQTEIANLGFAIKTHVTVGTVLILFWLNSFSGTLFG